MQWKKQATITALGGFLAGAALNNNFINDSKEVQCALCFTPGGACTDLIIRKIELAKKEILVQAYSFTSPEITDALIRSFKRGVKIKCIFDKSQARNIMVLKIADSGIPTFIDFPQGIAHNKVMIIDEENILTGSFNFTKAAQHRNVENSIHLHSKKIAKEYKDHWEKRQKISKPIHKEKLD